MKPIIISSYKPRLGLGLATLSLLTASQMTWASGTVSPQSEKYGYLPGSSIVLGQGFSIENPSSSPAPCIENVQTFPNSNRKISQNANINTYIVKTTSALKVVLGIDEQMDASMLTYSGSGSLDFNSEVDVDNNDATIVVQGDAEYGSDILDLGKVSYTSQAQALIDQRNFEDFRQLCGNALISGVNYGTKVSVVISIKGMSAQEKMSIDSNMSDSGGFGPLSASAKSHINMMMSHSNTSTEIKMQLFVRGGSGLPDMNSLVNSLLADGVTLQQLEPGMTTLFKDLTWDMAAVTGFTTQPYPGTDDRDANLITAMKEKALSMLVKDFRYQSGRYDRIFGDLNDQAMSNSTPADFQNISPGLISDVSGEIPALQRYVQALASAHEDCLADSSPALNSCSVPAKPFMPNIDLLYSMMTLGS